jgi:hypothetical protein
MAYLHLIHFNSLQPTGRPLPEPGPPATAFSATTLPATVPKMKVPAALPATAGSDYREVPVL